MVVSNDARCVKNEQRRKMYAQRRQSGARAVQYEARKNKINDVRKTWYQQNKGKQNDQRRKRYSRDKANRPLVVKCQIFCLELACNMAVAICSR